jgi:hypothetical protein
MTPMNQTPNPGPERKIADSILGLASDRRPAHRSIASAGLLRKDTFVEGKLQSLLRFQKTCKLGTAYGTAVRCALYSMYCVCALRLCKAAKLFLPPYCTTVNLHLVRSVFAPLSHRVLPCKRKLATLDFHDTSAAATRPGPCARRNKLDTLDTCDSVVTAACRTNRGSNLRRRFDPSPGAKSACPASGCPRLMDQVHRFPL